MLFLLVDYYPILFSIALSFFDWSFYGTRFVGFENYLRFFSDQASLAAFHNTIVYVFFTVGLGTALSLLLALAVNRVSPRVGDFYKVVYFIPAVVSVSAISLVWQWIYEPRVGVLNYLLHFVGIEPRGWLTDPRVALPSIILLGIWQNIGFNGVIFAAGLKGIDDSYYEAARMDGASPFQMFRFITLPLLRPITFFVVVTSIILSFRIFIPVFVLTKGGPLDATRVIVYEIYEQGFGKFQFGYASTLANLLLLFVGLITLVQMRGSRSKEDIY
jgi:multiple sugar transport system permease protein